MNLDLKAKSYAAISLCAMVLAMGTVALPTIAIAADHAAPILRAESSQMAAAPGSSSDGGNALSGSGGVLLSDNGSPVLTGAWCDPITNVCQAHPWTQNTHHSRTHEQ